MKVVFNTGRLYQPDGQIITATYDRPAGRILFMDYSRGIAGEINEVFWLNTETSLMNFVMQEYDCNKYRMSMDAMQLTRDPRVKPLPWRL